MKSIPIEIYDDILNGSRKRFPQGFWKNDKDNNYSDAAEITRYLIEEILGWDEKKVKKELCCKIFFKYKLKGMLYSAFNESVFATLNNAYPNKYKEWELACTPRNFWTLETAKRATIWLFKEHLQWDDKTIKNNISRKIFVDNGLDTMMHVIFNNNATAAISNAFPDLL